MEKQVLDFIEEIRKDADVLPASKESTDLLRKISDFQYKLLIENFINAFELAKSDLSRSIECFIFEGLEREIDKIKNWNKDSE